MIAKVKLERQQDAMQCGVACLKMICGAYGRRISLRELEGMCHAGAEGVSALGITDAAQEMGFHTVCTRLDAEQLCRVQLPAILHWEGNHFVVLYGTRRSGREFLIADPATGKRRMNREELERGWCSSAAAGKERGIAILMEPGPEFGKESGGKHSGERSLKFVAGYIRQYRRFFGQIALGLGAGSLLELAVPFLTQAIVDTGIKGKDISFIWLVLIAQMMLMAGRTAIDFIRSRILLHIGMKINISLVSDFLIKLLRLPMDFFDTKRLGDLMQRMGDHQRVQNFLTSSVLEIAFAAVSLVVLGVVLALYSLPIFAVFVAGSALYAAWTAFFMSRRKTLDYMLFEKNSKNSNKTYQFLTAMQEIKLQDCEQRRRWEWEDVQAETYDVSMRALRLQQIQQTGAFFINQTKNVLITAMSALAVIEGDISIGMMMAIQYVTGQLNAPVQQLMSFIYSLQDVRISLERINDIRRRPEERERCGTRREASDPQAGIELRDLEFRYNPHSPRPVLDSVSAVVPKGKVTAIVGTSGSGKSTLIKLMLGYYAQQRGELNVMGAPLLDHDLKWWRRQCGVVMQDGVIFSESIARNIASADGEIDLKRLEEAARTACIHDFIMTLPNGYDTEIGADGVGLSQGQKQRILIARAVYRNPEFIFLDEATNSLDANNERAIVENLKQFYRGRTVVVVAHRLSTVRDADSIIVMEKGRIAEAGTNDELVAARGAYYNLVKNQLELGS